MAPLLGQGSGVLTPGATRKVDSGHRLKNCPELPPTKVGPAPGFVPAVGAVNACWKRNEWPPGGVCVPRVTLPTRFGAGTG